jgi:hypothetical protein
MNEFREEDVTRTHYNFGGGRGAFDLTHTPTGLSVYSDTGTGSVIELVNRLMNELRLKVTGTEAPLG